MTLIALAVMLGALHVFYHSTAAADFDEVQEKMAAEAARTRQHKIHVVQMQEARRGLYNVQSQCNAMRSRLLSTPDILDVWNRMELDLNAKGYGAPAFNPSDEQDSTALAEYGALQEQVFRFDFRSRFADTVELLHRWENLEYGIRMANVVITPHGQAGLINVQLTFRLCRLLAKEGS